MRVCMWGCGSAGGDGSKLPCPTPFGGSGFDSECLPPVARPVLSLNRSVTQASVRVMVLNAWMRFTERLPLPQCASNQWEKNKVFVIGIDSHKDTLAACVVDHLGAPLEYRSIANTAAGHRELVDWAQVRHPVKVAVEGSGSLGRPVAVAALRAGLDVREVPPQLTAQVRRRGRTQTKTDQVDALVIARIALTDDTLAAPTWWENTEDLRVLVSYRHELVEDRTAQANRLHADLGKLRPGYQQNIRRLTTRKALDGALRLLWRDMSPHARIAKGRIRALRDLDRRIKGPDQPDRRPGQPNRNQPVRHIWGRHTRRRDHPRRGRQPPPLWDQSQVRHGQWDSTARSQLRKSGEASAEPGREPPTESGHPHRRPHPDRPPPTPKAAATTRNSANVGRPTGKPSECSNGASPTVSGPTYSSYPQFPQPPI